MTELAVLVPVLNRPQNVAPLVESYLATRPGDSVLVFILSADDHAEHEAVYKHTGTHVKAVIGGSTWPTKINEGVTRVTASWYLLAADDITFTPGWWDATKELRDDERVGVIGTNDSADGTGNPRVAAGEHTCHPLMRAAYIRDQGTVDAPRCAVHSAYHHWCVDDELIWTAKLREAWAYCPDAIIQHNHPYWGKGEMDDTYAKGEENADADMALWHDRAVRLLGLSIA